MFSFTPILASPYCFPLKKFITIFFFTKTLQIKNISHTHISKINQPQHLHVLTWLPQLIWNHGASHWAYTLETLILNVWLDVGECVQAQECKSREHPIHWSWGFKSRSSCVHHACCYPQSRLPSSGVSLSPLTYLMHLLFLPFSLAKGLSILFSFPKNQAFPRFLILISAMSVSLISALIFILSFCLLIWVLACLSSSRGTPLKYC